MSWSSARYSDRRKPGNLFDIHGIGKFRITVDGVDCTRDCFYASEEEGIVKRYLRNAADRLYVDPERDCAAEQTLSGVVKIEVLP